MKLKFLISGIILMTLCGFIGAEEKVFLRWAETPDALKKQWAGRYEIKQFPDAPDGKFCIVSDNQSPVVSLSFIPVKPDKQYILSGNLKSLGKTPSIAHIGLIMFDKNKKQIDPLNANVVSATATELAVPAKKGDKTILIKDAKGWKISVIYGVAFNAMPDFSDLPNCDIVPGVLKIIPRGDVAEVQLNTPLNKDYPAGTKLREHQFGAGFYIYPAFNGGKVPEQWRNYSGTLGMAKPGESSHSLLRPGTAFVRIIVLPNYRQAKGAAMAVTDLKLIEKN